MTNRKLYDLSNEPEMNSIYTLPLSRLKGAQKCKVAVFRLKYTSVRV